MTPATSTQAAAAPAATHRIGRAVQTLAAAVLMLCVVGRAFITEHNYRVAPLAVAMAVNHALRARDPASQQAGHPPSAVNYQDLSRATFAVALLAAGGLWLIGGALAGGVAVRGKALGGVVLIFAGCSLVSAMRAGDTRGAMLVWWEQLAMMSACLLAAQVFADRRRRNMLLCLLAAVAATVAVKGLVQVYDEWPAMIARLAESPELLTETTGWHEGSIDTQLLKLRLAARTPSGFFVGLPNVFASLLLLAGAAAVGLLAERVAALVGALRQRRAKPTGDISPLATAALVTLVPAGLAVWLLVMTRSAGAAAAAGLAGAAGLLAVVFAKALRRRWRRVMLVVAATGVLAAAAVVGHGMTHDSLPSKTMTVRWFYWTGSAEVVGDEPMWGVGGGNFQDAYLLHRRGQAEEAVKAPHNVVLNAACQFGLIGGSAYLAALAMVMVGACRPRRDELPCPPALPPSGSADRDNGLIGCGAIAAVLAVRAAFGEAGLSGPVFILQAVMPAALFALVLTGVYLAGRADTRESAWRIGRVAVACGLGAFLLHNMVSFSLWTPGAATVFWVLGGAMLAGGARVSRPIVRGRWAVAVGGAAVVVAAGAMLWWPIWRQTAHWRAANRSLAAGDVAGALSASAAAAEVWDDPLSFADAARLRGALATLGGEDVRPGLLKEAMALADRACAAAPTKATLHSLAANLAWTYAAEVHDNAAAAAGLSHGELAVQRDPMNMPLRLTYAEMLSEMGLAGRVLRQVEQVEWINSQLPLDSVYRLSQPQRDRIARLRADNGER